MSAASWGLIVTAFFGLIGVIISTLSNKTDAQKIIQTNYQKTVDRLDALEKQARQDAQDRALERDEFQAQIADLKKQIHDFEKQIEQFGVQKKVYEGQIEVLTTLIGKYIGFGALKNAEATQ